MFCTKVKEYLSHEHVSFVDQKLGFMTTPVTVIGEKVIVGFDQRKLSEALNLEESGS